MSGDRLLLLTPLRQALERIERKARPLLADPSLTGGQRRGRPPKASQGGETGGDHSEQMGLGL